MSIALALKAGENHLRDLMDWLEEIEARDGVPVRDVLQSSAIENIKTDPRLGRADRLKRIKDQIRRMRFPRLSHIEDSIQSRIRELKLQPDIKLSVPPGLEGGDLRVEFSAASTNELKNLIKKLGDAADSQSLAEIFAMLKGDIQRGEQKDAR
ncbi:MAG: hypothetical protein ACREO5_08210 [Candidatus Binatia bacterium]